MPQAFMKRSARSISSAIARSAGPRGSTATNSWFHDVDLRQVGEAALGEGPQQVQRRRRLVVRGEEPVGVGGAGRRVGATSLTMWPRKRRQGRAPRPSRSASERGLGELAGDAADLHHRHAGRVGEHHGHLQDDLQLVADGVGGEVVEGLGAVAGLQQEGLSRRPPGPGRRGGAGPRRRRPAAAGSRAP